VENKNQAAMIEDPREDVRRKFGGRSDAVLKEEPGAIGVCPTAPGSFEVWLSWNPQEYTVSCEGWHEHFNAKDEALTCFAFCLTLAARLKITYAGNVAYKWTLERVEGGQITREDTTALLLFPFWRHRRVEHRQNSLSGTVRNNSLNK
jgi:hypothetical protein